MIALIKPQFEVGKGKVGKGGVVRSHPEHMRVVDEISDCRSGTGLSRRRCHRVAFAWPEG